MLKTNFGIPVVVVATKSDAQAKLEQDLGYRQEKLDFVQLHLRQFCLRHGASLVYTGPHGKNKDVLYQAIVNAAYGQPLRVKVRDVLCISGSLLHLRFRACLSGGGRIDPALVVELAVLLWL